MAMANQCSPRMQSPLCRQQSHRSLLGTPDNQSPVLVRNDDESEKRSRRFSIMIERQISQSPRGSYNPIANLNAVQLADHYTNCMRLATQNKINQNNAFQLQLIDYMAMMLKKKDSPVENFQVASCALDASTKIYACRVDNVYSNAHKLAAGFSRSANANKKNENILDFMDKESGASSQSGKHKKIKRSSMIATNLEKLNLKESVTSKIDLYSKRMLRKCTEEQSGGCQLLQNLRFHDDSQDYALASDACWWREREPKVIQPLASVTVPFPDLKVMNSAQICPAFSSFTFIGWKPQMDCNSTHSSLPEDFGSGQILKRDADHAFDMDAIPEKVPVVEDVDNNEDATDDLEIMEKVGCHEEGRKSSWQYEWLRNSLSREPGEYSYFQKAAKVGWSGPINWKVKPILRKGAQRRTSFRKNNTSLLLEYEEVKDDDFKITKSNLYLSNSAIERWSDLRTTLPQDLNIYPSSLFRLFLKSQLSFSTNNTTIINVEGLNPFNFDNTKDREDYCPNLVVDETLSEDSMELHEMGWSRLPDIEKLTTEESGYDLVPVPHMVPKYDISYAKEPKRLHMKRLQEVIYKIISARESAQEEVTASAHDPEEIRRIHQFGDVYRKIPEKLPAKEAKNLSVQIAFVALLHVATEKGLQLQGSDNLADITISKGANKEQ